MGELNKAAPGAALGAYELSTGKIENANNRQEAFWVGVIAQLLRKYPNLFRMDFAAEMNAIAAEKRELVDYRTRIAGEFNDLFSESRKATEDVNADSTKLLAENRQSFDELRKEKGTAFDELHRSKTAEATAAHSKWESDMERFRAT